MLKTCSSCGEAKPSDADHFYRARRKPDGLTPTCKVCTSIAGKTSYAKRAAKVAAYAKAKRAADPEKSRRASRQNYLRRRAAVLEATRVRYQRNKARILASRRERYADRTKPRELFLARKWRQAHPEKVAEYSRNGYMKRKQRYG